jgi:phytoene/squalene synthetase
VDAAASTDDSYAQSLCIFCTHRPSRFSRRQTSALHAEYLQSLIAGVASDLDHRTSATWPDLRAGRPHLPTEEVAHHGSSRAHLERLADNFCAPRTNRHRRHLPRRHPCTNFPRPRALRARSPRGFRDVRLPVESRLAITLAATLYDAILDQIEAADCDVFSRRAATSTWFKLMQALRCWSLGHVPALVEPPSSSSQGLAVRP